MSEKTLNIIGETMIGSHIWEMNHVNSDEDYFSIYLDDTRNFLRGTPQTQSYFTQYNYVDTHYHELGKVVEQLLKGNINFLIGVTSPIVMKMSFEFERLIDITMGNLSKKTYHSIHGMGLHNYKRYIETDEDTSEHRCNKILRTIVFGIKLLDYGRIEYKKFEGGTPELIESKLKELDRAFENSTILEEPNEKTFRDYLEDVRYENLRF